MEELGDRYFLLGPYNEQNVRTEVEVIEPENKVIADVVASMRERGVKVSYLKYGLAYTIIVRDQ